MKNLDNAYIISGETIMGVSKQDGYYKCGIRGKNIEIFIGENGVVEMYEADEPGKTGFVFNSVKELTLFCNYLCDIVENEEKNAKV